MKNYYETLNLKQAAQTAEIKKAYFELAKKYHPDSGDEAEVKRFYQITEAYKILSDKDLRKAYDLSLNSGLEMIKTAEEEIISKNPVEPTFQRQKREAYRDDELKEFHKNRFKKAVLRVIVFTLIFSVAGALVSLVLGGRWYLGILAGLCIGFSISIRENFDIDTFFEAKKNQMLFHWFVWLILILGILYFAGVGIFSIL